MSTQVLESEFPSQLATGASDRPVKELLVLAAPTVAQSISYTINQFIDTWMLSRLGTEAPTAAGNAGMFAFSVICFGFGTLLVVNTLVSQHYGRGEFARCGRYLWQGYWVALVYSVLVLPGLIWLPHAFTAFGHAPHLAAMEATFLRIVLCGTLFKLIAVATGQFLLATNRPNRVLVAAAIGVAANTLAGYALIFGRLGCPQLGVAGSAWAQFVGGVVEMALLLWFVFADRAGAVRFGARDWVFRAREAVTFVKIGAGSGLQTAADVLAWTLFLNFIFAPLGEPAMAANQFMFRYMVVSFMPAWGIAQAVTALVGRYIGMGRPDVAMARADLGFAIGGVYMLICGGLMITLRYPLIHVFSRDPEVVRMGVLLLIFAGVYQLFDAMYVVYNGALRGAGDTFVPAIVTAALCWALTVFGGYWMVRGWPRLGVAGPWTLCTIYGIVLGLFMVVRFRRGGWRKIHLVNGNGNGDAAAAASAAAASNVQTASATLSPAAS